jgi:hypothetical protein
MNTITENVEQYLNGEGKIGDQPVLVTNNDFRVTVGQIYSRLCQDDQYGFAIGKGLVKKGSDRQFRPLSFTEWKEAIVEIFVFARFQGAVGVAPRECAAHVVASPKPAQLEILIWPIAFLRP